MDQVKSFLMSKAFWTSVLGFFSTLPFAAKYTAGWDIGGIAEQLAALAPILFALAGYFRVTATKQVVLASPGTAKSMNEAGALGLMKRPGSMTAFLLAFLLVPFLAGCVTPSARAVVLPADATRADVAVYNASQQVAQYCNALRFAVGIGEMFAKTKRHQQYVLQAQAVVATYCDQPPGDVRGALIFLADAYKAIMAVPAVKVEVQAAKLSVQ